MENKPIDYEAILKDRFPALGNDEARKKVIDCLKAAVSQAADEWISVETPPEDEGWYQCCKEKGVYLYCHSYRAKTNSFTAYGEVLPDPDVTHYRKLPKSPSELKDRLITR